MQRAQTHGIEGSIAQDEEERAKNYSTWTGAWHPPDIGSEFSHDSAQQARPHPRRVHHTRWVASWSRGGPQARAHITGRRRNTNQQGLAVSPTPGGVLATLPPSHFDLQAMPHPGVPRRFHASPRSSQ